jgi:hypothetical protein
MLLDTPNHEPASESKQLNEETKDGDDEHSLKVSGTTLDLSAQIDSYNRLQDWKKKALCPRKF